MSTLQSHHTVSNYCSPWLKGAEKGKFRVVLIIGLIRHGRDWHRMTHKRLHNVCSHFVFLKLVWLVLLFNEPWIHSLKGQKYSLGKLKERWLSFILQWAWLPTVCWFTTNSCFDDHLSAFKVSKLSIMLVLLLLVLPTLTSSTVLAWEGLFLSPSVCFSCHSAVFHPSNLLSAYFTSASLPWGGHLQRPSTSQMYLLNPVLPSSLQTQSYPQDLIIQLIPLLVFCAYLSSSPDSQT